MHNTLWNSTAQQTSFPHLKAVPPPPAVLPTVSYPYLKTVPPPPPASSTLCQGPAGSPYTAILARPKAFVPSPTQNGRKRQNNQTNRGRGGKFTGNPARGGRFNGAPARNVPTNTDKANKVFCETCDRAFKSHQELNAHIKEHKVCGIDGCQFTAHPKIVAKHVEAQHDSGLFKRVLISSNPDEVAKWREERRKRFPTRANIALRLAAQNERRERGERITNHQGRFAQRGKWRKNRNTGPRTTNQSHCQFENTTRNTTNTKPSEPKPSENVTKAVPLAASSLVADYGSDESDSAPEEAAISRELVGPPLLPKNVETLPKTFVAPPPEKKAKLEPVRQQTTVRQTYLKHHRPPTLLEKLLENDIRHERNVILQCIRHVINNNFFQ